VIARLARLGLVVASIACALYLARGAYAVGLDFEGGVHVVVRAPAGATDARGELERAVDGVVAGAKLENVGDVYAIELAGGDDHDARLVIGALPTGFRVEDQQVIRAVLDPRLGRTLGTLLAALAAACWLGGLRIRRGSLAMVGTLALAWAAALAELVHGGATLSRTTHIAALGLALPAALAIALAAGRPAKAAWPGAALLGLVLAGSIAAELVGGSRHGDWQPYWVALRMAHRAAPAVVVVAASALAAVADLLPASRRAA